MLRVHSGVWGIIAPSGGQIIRCIFFWIFKMVFKSNNSLEFFFNFKNNSDLVCFGRYLNHSQVVTLTQRNE